MGEGSSHRLKDSSDFVLTLDIDWAPDWMIDRVAEILTDNAVKATWFATHASPAVDRLKQRTDLFEIGIHPNCLPGSTHGNTEDETLSHMKALFPDADIMRTHGLYQSTAFLIKAATQFGIRIDVSLLLCRAPHLSCHCIRRSGMELWRVPFVWEDDIEMFEKSPIWSISDPGLDTPGLKVFDFHPVHILLNTIDIRGYDRLKESVPISNWTSDQVLSHRADGPGPASLFQEIVQRLRGKGAWMREIVDAAR